MLEVPDWVWAYIIMLAMDIYRMLKVSDWGLGNCPYISIFIYNIRGYASDLTDFLHLRIFWVLAKIFHLKFYHLHGLAQIQITLLSGTLLIQSISDPWRWRWVLKILGTFLDKD